MLHTDLRVLFLGEGRHGPVNGQGFLFEKIERQFLFIVLAMAKLDPFCDVVLLVIV